MNFPDKTTLDKAKENMIRMEKDLKIETREKEKMLPKVMLCNVSNLEKDDDIVESIRYKNTWLQELIDETGDTFKEVAKMKAKGNTYHSIIKCSPKIRKAIYNRGDYIFTAVGRTKVIDRYHVRQCYKCQGFGHESNNCKNAQACARCGGEHRSSECESESEKCVNCVKASNHEIDHRSYSNICPIYNEEIARIRNNTDHGI